MNNLKKYILFLLLVATSFFSFSQELTKIKGQVIDATTKQPMPFVNVVFVGANVGATTDFDGNYYIETQWATSKLMASFIGYTADTLKVAKGKSVKHLIFLLKNLVLPCKNLLLWAEKHKIQEQR
jgi:hypothetical protein